MECKKEVVIRDKNIAQKKIEDKDFVGAMKIGMKAQQIYADIENIF